MSTGHGNKSFSHPERFAGQTVIILLFSFFSLVMIGWLDYFTGYELGFFIFYFIPVSLAAWYGGQAHGIAAAISSAIVWYLSDKLTFHPYSNSYFIYWEMFMRLLSFLTTAFTLARIRKMVLQEERLITELICVKQQLAEAQGRAHGENVHGSD